MAYSVPARGITSGSLERYAWLFMRVSGVLLLFLAVGHLGIMHLIIGVDNLTFEVVAERWSTPFWRIYDMLLLVLALFHGINGARVLVDDYIRSRGWRVFSLSSLYTFGVIFFIIGTVVLLTFQPTQA